MPRRLRRSLPRAVLHVMNRAVRGTVIFERTADYEAFARLVREASRKYQVKIIATGATRFLTGDHKIKDLSF